MTKYVCSQCGKTLDDDATVIETAAWLIGPRHGGKVGEMVIRCPDHVTRYAAQQIEPSSRSEYAAHMAR